MKNSKKYIMLPLVALTAIAVPVATVVSCGNKKTTTTPDKSKTGTTTTDSKAKGTTKKSPIPIDKITSIVSSRFTKKLVKTTKSGAIAQTDDKYGNSVFPSGYQGNVGSHDIKLENTESERIIKKSIATDGVAYLSDEKGLTEIKDVVAKAFVKSGTSKSGNAYSYQYYAIASWALSSTGTTTGTNVKPYNGKITPKAVGPITYNTSNNYYIDAQTLQGEALLKKLHEIQGKHTHGIGSYTGLYRTYATAFKDNIYEKDNSLIDLYSENPDPKGKDPYNYKSTDHGGNYKKEGDIYNREHVIPQSWFGKKHPMHDDAQMVWPSDGKVNGMRSNYPHGPVSSMSWESRNGSKLGTNSQFGGTVFEPIDEFKGDVARTYLYFAVAYWDSIVSHQQAKKVFTRSFPYMSSSYLKMYIKWAKEDPVDKFDMQRNVEIAKVQGNRNPFIDYPNLIDAIWGKDGSGTPTTTFKNKGVAMSIK